MAFVDSGRLGVDLARIDSVAKYPLGTRVQDEVGGEYVYVEANGTIAASEAVTLKEGFLATQGAVGEYVFGVAQAALVDAQFAWVKVKGRIAAEVDAGVAADDILAAGVIAAAGHMGEVTDTGTVDQTVRAIALTAIDTPVTGQAWVFLL